MKKNLLLYHFHRHLDEVYYASQFFNRSQFLKENFDVLLLCNNKNHKLDSIVSKAKFNTTVTIGLSENNAGYQLGHGEAHSESYDVWSKYENVIFSQIDCFIVDSTPLEKEFQEQFDALVCKPSVWGELGYYSGDFFILKPCGINIFKDWVKYIGTDTYHEKYLTEFINQYYTVKYQNRNWDEILIRNKPEPSSGLWHTHDNNLVKAML